jgi:SHAQKYF class myb-like DNA-binding protein
MEKTTFGGGGGSYPYENGVVMMTRDPRPRLRWTADLHDRFIDAVTKLGGPDSKFTQIILLFSCLNFIQYLAREIDSLLD